MAFPVSSPAPHRHGGVLKVLGIIANATLRCIEEAERTSAARDTHHVIKPEHR